MAQNWKENLHLVARMIFGALFIWSGVAKIKQPIQFAEAVRHFEIVTDPVAPALALLIPCVEIVAGILTMTGLLWRGAVATLVTSLVIFTLALVTAWIRKLDITCGCFGGSGAVNYPWALIRNILLGAAAFALIKRAPK